MPRWDRRGEGRDAASIRTGFHAPSYLAGRKVEAEAAAPDGLVDEVALCGPPGRIRGLAAEWRSSGVTTLMVAGDRLAARAMAELVL